jgi:hypothetical protein
LELTLMPPTRGFGLRDNQWERIWRHCQSK